MKKNSVFLVMLAVTLAFGLTLTGCGTLFPMPVYTPSAPSTPSAYTAPSTYTAPLGALYEENERLSAFPMLAVPLKDFTSLGIVLAENIIENDQGEVFTYYALLKEAQRLGADTIINVSISKRKRMGSTDETWFGAATAIKYLAGTLNATVLMSTTGSSFGIDASSGILLSSGASSSPGTGSSQNTNRPSTR